MYLTNNCAIVTQDNSVVQINARYKQTLISRITTKI